MSLTLSTMKEKLQIWALRKFDEDKLGDFDDTEFLDLVNQVAEDFNLEAAIRRERYYQETTSGETNYEMQGVIKKVLLFKYHSTEFETQYYSFAVDTIVLKNSPGGQIQLDIHYLRAVEALVDPTDEVDLPDSVLLDYLDLVKKRLEVEYGDEDEAVYTAYLKTKAHLARKGRHIQPIHPGVMRVWGTWAGGDAAGTLYVDNVSADFEAETIKVSGGTNDATVAATSITSALAVLKTAGIVEREEA